MATIYEALKEPMSMLVIGRRWLVYDSDGDFYTVYERRYGAKNSIILIDGATEDQAVNALLSDKEDE